MHHSLFSLASALILSSVVPITSAAAASLSPREPDNQLDKRLVCVGDSFNEVFASVGMGLDSNGVQADLTSFCRSWIDIPDATSYLRTTTPTTTFFPATVTVESTTQVVFSATSTVTVTTSETNYALKRRSYVRKDKFEARAPAPEITARAVLPRKMIVKARQAASSANTRTLDVVALGLALSSACSCKRIPPLTQYLTSTADVATRTIGATDYRTVTVNTTVPGGITTVTLTVNVTSTIRPTGSGPLTSDITPTGISNSTMMGTETGGYTAPPYTGPWNNTRTGGPTGSYGTGSHGLPYSTSNTTCAPCSTGYRNITATITAFATSTIVSTFTDVQSALIVKNSTITVAGSTVTLDSPEVTVTATVTGPGVVVTQPCDTLTYPTVTETVTVTEGGIVFTEPCNTLTYPTVTTTITEPAETSTVTVTQPTTTTEAAETSAVTVTATEVTTTTVGRARNWHKAGRN